MVEIDNNHDFDIGAFRRRLEKAGANVTRSEHHEKMEMYTMDFYLAGGEPQKQFPSSLEVDESGNVEMVQFRMPTFTTSVDESGLAEPAYERAKRGKMDELWSEIKEDICELLEEEVGADCRYGVIQDRGIEIRAQHGYNRIIITPHIEFLRGADGYAPIDRDGVVDVARALNDMWENEYFNVEVVDRQNI